MSTNDVKPTTPMIGGQFMEQWLNMPEQLKKQGDNSPYAVHNDFFRFFCFFLAFNHLYDCYSRKHPHYQPCLQVTKEWAERKQKQEERNGKYWTWKPSDREDILYFIKYAFEILTAHFRQKPNETTKDYHRRAAEWTAFLDSAKCILLHPVIEGRQELDEKQTHPHFSGTVNINDEEPPLLKYDLVNTMKTERDKDIQLRLKLQMVFLRIYQVRCNLFHGEKDPNNENDIACVKDSADVLEKFLWFIVRDCHGEIW